MLVSNNSHQPLPGQTLKEAGYASWSSGQPDSSPHPYGHVKKEFCGAMFRTGLLDDIWCDVEFAFICERDLPDKNNNEEVIEFRKQQY